MTEYHETAEAARKKRVSLSAFRAEMRSGIRAVNDNMTQMQTQHEEVIRELSALRHEITSVRSEVDTVKQDVGGLLDLKKQGIGFLAAITLTGGLLLLGVQSWLRDISAALRGP